LYRSTLIAMVLVATASAAAAAQDVPHPSTHESPRPATHAAARAPHVAAAPSGHEGARRTGHDAGRTGTHEAAATGGHGAPRSGGHDAAAPATRRPTTTALEAQPGGTGVSQMLTGVPTLSLRQRARIDSIQTRYQVMPKSASTMEAEEREIRDILMPSQQAVFDRNVAAARGTEPRP
jgi:hypothetical protein